MCGIAGVVDYSGGAKQYDDVYGEMLFRLRRRGPDENGIYLNQTACLLHTRLAVVDPEHGKQPMRIGNTVLAYNGELYNTGEIRRELILRGHSFKEHSDTEVVLHSYLEWGGECPEHFNGIFAFAVWDEINRTLFLARDRMGVKPLFYSETGGNFIFASEIKAILCHPSVKPEIDAVGISELFLLGPGRTPGFGVFRHIKELKPGHCASLSKENGLKIKSYWQLEAKENHQTFSETVKNVSYLVKDAIKRQTVSDVPLCAFLSGGLDSSAIAALSGVKHTFSVDYDDNAKYFKQNAFQPDSDNGYIKEMTDFLGTEHTNIVVGIDELTDALFDAAEARDLPGMADVDSSLLLFCRSVKQYATVALSGECADEYGYPNTNLENLRIYGAFGDLGAKK